MRRLWTLAWLALAAACAAPPRSPLETCLERTKYGTPETRYYAARKLARYDAPDARDALRELLKSEDPMLRNAAARSLCDRGEPEAAAHLISNLHRDMRTYVCTDAIFHLRALHGQDLGYSPNLGYRHQTEKQRAWRDWWRAQGREESPEPARPAPARDEERAALQAEVDDWIRLAEETPDAAGGRMMELWTELARHAKSRDLADVALREHAFGAFAKWRADDPDLWNNHALAALNNGHFATAERSYRRALELAPERAQLHNDLGILLDGLGRLEEAEAAYREAHRLAPKDDVAAANLADVIAARERVPEAIAMYRAAERLAPAKWYYHRLWIRRLEGR